MDKMIDLGKEDVGCCVPEKSPVKKSKKYYPNLYISDVKGLELDVGDVMFVAKGVVRSTSERKTEDGKTTYTCDIEIHSMKPVSDGDDDLDSTFGKLAKKKMAEKEED